MYVNLGMLRNYFRASLDTHIGKNLPAMRETRVQFLGWENPLEKGMATHCSIFAGKSHGQRSLVGYSPWGHKEYNTTEWLTLSLRNYLIPRSELTINCLILQKKKIVFSIFDSLWFNILSPIFFSPQQETCPSVIISKKNFNLCFILSFSFSSSHTNVYTHTHTHHTNSKWQLQSKSLQSPKCGQDK